MCPEVLLLEVMKRTAHHETRYHRIFHSGWLNWLLHH
jgi:hypothetical protein